MGSCWGPQGPLRTAGEQESRFRSDGGLRRGDQGIPVGARRASSEPSVSRPATVRISCVSSSRCSAGRSKVQDFATASRLLLADRGFGQTTQGVELAGKDGEALLSLALVQAVVADAERAGTG